MMRAVGLAILSVAAMAAPAWPCEVIGPVRTHENLVRDAQVVVRARAEEGVDRPGRQGVFPVATQVRFRVLAVYRGKLSSDLIQFNGHLWPVAASGDRPRPFDFKRPRNQTPSCYANGYQQGAEYLLFLGTDDGIYSQVGELTPYWAPQAPTNERLTGDDDPWLRWVIAAIKNR
jgi:hypothetical protein